MDIDDVCHFSPGEQAYPFKSLNNIKNLEVILKSLQRLFERVNTFFKFKFKISLFDV